MKRIVDNKRVKNRKHKINHNSIKSSSNFNTFDFENDKKIDSFSVSKRTSRKATNSAKLKYILIFRIVSLIIILICLFCLYNWFKENNKNKDILVDIKSQVSLSKESTENTSTSNGESAEKDYSLDFKKLKELNPDIVGWLKINNTDIDFPVVKGKNNDYYMTHNFNKDYNSAGWIFADYRNTFNGTDKNTIIYGHNRRDGSMFSTLNNTLDPLWYTSPDNHIVTLHTPTKNLYYRVFAVYKVNAEEFDNSTNFKLSKEYEDYLNTSINRSVYNFDVEVTTLDKILTIYTCANNNQYRIILQAKLITE